MSLTPSQLEAVRDLQQTFDSVPMVIIGAAALAFYGGRPWRHTADVNLVVALELEDFPGALLDSPGWTSHPTKPHESFRRFSKGSVPKGLTTRPW